MSPFEQSLIALIREAVRDVIAESIPRLHAPLPGKSPEDLLTVAAIATEVGVARKTVRVWIKNKKLRASRAGGGLRIRRGDLEAMLKPAQPTLAPSANERANRILAISDARGAKQRKHKL